MEINRNYELRDKILFGGYEPSKYYGGIRRTNASATTVRELYDLGFIDPYDSQNDSPTAIEFLNVIEGDDDNVMFEVYAVSPDREDYRITIEGIVITIIDRDLLASYVNKYHDADEFYLTSNDSEYTLRAWWD